MKELTIFRVTLMDANRFKRVIDLEAKNKATLELGLNGTLGMSGCEILQIDEYTEVDY